MRVSVDSSKLMYSSGNNDECYTPDYGVKPILKYIPEQEKMVDLLFAQNVIRVHLCFTLVGQH